MEGIMRSLLSVCMCAYWMDTERAALGRVCRMLVVAVCPAVVISKKTDKKETWYRWRRSKVGLLQSQ